jgi:type II secretory pathway pseudopilin PulG
MKRGAMFGLDARIALAIFGALSVISGAALYSAIKQSKVTAFLTDITELAKAFEAYYLDVGAELALTDPINYEAAELVTSSKPGWKGPYIDYPVDTRFAAVPNYKDKFLRYSRVGDSSIYFSELISNTFTATSGTSGTSCASDADCAIYLAFSTTARTSELVQYRTDLDEMIDGGDGIAKGKIKGFDHSGGGIYLYYKIMEKNNYK